MSESDFQVLGDFMLPPPFAQHVVARLISGSIFLTAAGLCSTAFAAPTISIPAGTQTVNENLALTNATRTQLNFASFIQLVASSPADSTSTFKVRLSVTHGAVYLSTTAGLAAAGGTLFDAATNAPVGPMLNHGPSTNIDSITVQGTFAAINTALTNLVYTPNIYYNGSDVLKIEVFNPGLPAVFDATATPLATATASISVAATTANQRKVALNDFNGVTQNQTASGNVLSNDLNPGPGLAVTAFTVGGVAGTVGTDFPIAGVGVFNLASTGAYTFKPAANYLGPIPEIAYTATDTSPYTTNSSLWLTMLPVTRVSGTADINAPDASQAMKADTSGDGIIDEAEARAGVANYVNISTPNNLSLAGGTYTKDIDGVNIVPVTIRGLSTNNPGGGWLQPSLAAATSMMDYGEWGTNPSFGPLGPSFDFEMAFAKKTVARLSTLVAPPQHLPPMSTANRLAPKSSPSRPKGQQQDLTGSFPASTWTRPMTR
ncbi:hypothetical protein G7048_18785 [Diaphorobacter sp. HDW4B]|uniref:Ig-like domain-containing protein n=1 Tax=Diaphorobacter sp. HDW4B TaxID=2714925 RepID=UPI00140857F6|nr:Ig-like domain-containing protein [Diaphorobacter sp. HDW4B]QIL72228.1 hypothetical protein G7048_18785 [Diaphorobacter sp. HDW4B]